jgi:hypothetical protein
MNRKISSIKLLFPLLAMMATALVFSACSGEKYESPITSSLGTEDEAQYAQPYAGLQNRPIKAIAPERVEDLIAGRGAGFALAAELNSYPGPTHVLMMAEDLDLSNDQKLEIEGLFDVMSSGAKALGQDLVTLEMDLDESFRKGTINQETLTDLTERISGVEGQLRALHLGTHLTMVNILSDEQIDEYDRLRGYSVANGSENEGTEMDHSNMAEHG